MGTASRSAMPVIAAGGQGVSRDGALAVDIPAGALAADTKITICTPDQADVSVSRP